VKVNYIVFAFDLFIFPDRQFKLNKNMITVNIGDLIDKIFMLGLIVSNGLVESRKILK
jgi:hypothetical protein